MSLVYLSLGSNVGNRLNNLENAIERLKREDVKVLRQSSVFETEPQDIADQPWFLNLVLEAETGLFPKQLLSRIHRIESGMGRRRTVEKGPRTIDIDILLFGKYVIGTEELTVPHPRMHMRRFVLEPLAELAPDLRHPVLASTVNELLKKTKVQKLRRVARPQAGDKLRKNYL